MEINPTKGEFITAIAIFIIIFAFEVIILLHL